MTKESIYQEAYDTAYNGLNTAQKAAVDSIEGPVMVIAGPGTGKTQILSVRIGNILQKTDALPENILCLTYTDAGTIAMRSRLLSFIGPDAYRVQIQTFHAFCNDVIQANMEHFGRRDLDLVSDLERVVMVESMLQNLPPSHVLRKFKGDLSNDIAKLNDLFRRMKEEDWTAELVAEAVAEYLASLPDRDGYTYKRASSKTGAKVGDLKMDLIRKETDNMEKLQAAAELFPVFQQKMKEAGRYDYSDMILWVVQAFRTDTNMLRNYQEKYLYVLVDEYQDTNGAQNEVLQMLISYWDIPNVFVVGDDDQSIYEFQGARVKNILELYQTYHERMQTVVLTDNYRSTQPVLDVAKELIEHNTDRLINHIDGLTKNLYSKGAGVSADTTTPELRVYQNTQQEYAGVLTDIEECIRSGVSPSEIAVIYHRHAQADPLIDLFERKRIPYTVKKRYNTLDHPLIRQILHILTYVGLEYQKPNSGEHLLFELLYYPYFDIHRMDVLSLAGHMQSKRSENSWRLLLGEPDLLKKIKLRNPESLEELQTNIGNWVEEVANLTLPMLMEKIINDGHILQYAVQHTESHFLLELLNSLFDFVKAEASRNPEMRVEDLIELFVQMRAHKLVLPVQRTTSSKDGVQFITCHSAKGLEFSYVYLIGCTKNKWEKARGSNFHFSFPDTLTFSNEANKEEALRRLFYVAVTRAKKHLYVSYAESDEGGKVQEPSMFIAEAAHLQKRLPEVAAAVMTSLQELALTIDSDPPVADLFDTAYLRSRVQHLSLSASMLNTFLDCPIKFYFSSLLRVPQAKNDSMQFGTAVHHALQKLFNDMRETGQFASEQFLLDEFRYHLRLNRDAFTEKQFKNRMEYGELILPEYYRHYVNGWNKVVVTEYPIREVNWKNIPLNGKLDKLEFDGNNVNVVDYKTGQIKWAKEKLTSPGEKLPLGGDYWRQMVFYRILLEQQRLKPWHMVSGEFDFIEKNPETGKFEKIKLPISESDVAFVKAQIEDVYEKIQALAFTDGCGKEDCYYCNLLKS